MTKDEALMAVALLQGFFPAPELPEMTMDLWAESLEKYDAIDARNGIRTLAETRTKVGPVSLAEVLASVKAVWRDREERQATHRLLALPDQADPAVNALIDGIGEDSA